MLPLLKVAGWSDEQIVEQFPITAGRIVTVGKKHRRGDALWADYVLEYVPGVPVAIVGEIGDLKVGRSDTKEFDLKPGHYVFACNLAGHYRNGMYTELTVK